MRFQVGVILPASVSDIVGMVEQMMGPYDTERPVLPYRQSITDQECLRIAQEHGVSTHDPALRDILSQQFGSECFHDEQGYHYWSTDNPKGYWDGWMLHDLQRDTYHLPDPLLSKHDLLAIITPEGIWHQFPYRWDETAQDIVQRQKDVQQIFVAHPSHIVVLVDCHC